MTRALRGKTADSRRPAPGRFAAGWVGALLLVALGLSTPLAARETSAGSAPAPADPVLRDVVRLLEAKLGEALILRWLTDSDRRPGRPSAEDLVALKRAGASDELIVALLDRAGTAAPAGSVAAPVEPVSAARASASASPSPAAAPAPAAPPATTAPPAPASSSTPAAAVIANAALAPVAAVESAGATAAVSPSELSVPTDLSLRYIHVPDDGDPWQLVVYLDGRPAAPLEAASSERSAPTWSEHRSLAPGPHRLRWARERHRERTSESGPHAARFDSESLEFTLLPGAPVAIEFEFRDRSGPFLRPGGPVDARVTQREREIAARHTNNDPAKWPLLCEDLEASLAGKKPGFDDRRELRACVRWAELWKGLPAVPGRDEVRPPVR